jgi:hypothetical protein
VTHPPKSEDMIANPYLDNWYEAIATTPPKKRAKEFEKNTYFPLFSFIVCYRNVCGCLLNMG